MRDSLPLGDRMSHWQRGRPYTDWAPTGHRSSNVVPSHPEGCAMPSTRLTLPDLEIRKVRGMGRGVFARRAFRRGEVIEVSPVLHLPGVSDDSQLCGGLT